MLYLKTEYRKYLYDKEKNKLHVFDAWGNYMHDKPDDYDIRKISFEKFIPVVIKAELKTAGVGITDSVDTTAEVIVGNKIAELHHRYELGSVRGRMVIEVFAIARRA